MIFSQQIVTFFFVEDPVCFFPDIDAEEGRLADVDAAGVDERPQVSVEEGEEEGRDMVSVAVGIGEQDDFVVSEVIERASFAKGATEGVGDVAQFLILQDFIRASGFGVEDFTAEGEDGLSASIASLFCGAASGVAFDEEKFTFFGFVR